MLLFVWPLAQAQSTASAFTKCARIANDARRLSCYDRLASDLIELGISTMDTPQAAAGPVTTTNPASTESAPAATAKTSTRSAPPQTKAVTVTESTTAVVAATAPDASAATVEGEFGLERTEAKQARELKKIQSRYAGEFNGWDGDTEFPLENGQVWKQIRSGRLAWHADHPMITIDRKGFMGAYRLSVEGVNRKVIVRRIK
jgi:hypothetical protein